MAKRQALDSVKPRPLSTTPKRGGVPSAELIPMQFRMPPVFVKAFKQAALDRDMKLNELLNACFEVFMKKARNS